MELKEFIKQTLATIVEATEEAKEELKDSVDICPHTIHEYNGYPSVTTHGSGGPEEDPLIVVDFRLLIEVCQSQTQGGHVGARVLQVLEARYKENACKDERETHVVSFSVPLVWKKRRGR